MPPNKKAAAQKGKKSIIESDSIVDEVASASLTASLNKVADSGSIIDDNIEAAEDDSIIEDSIEEDSIL